jgi:imidazolonepropionase-like amidohydrolase
MDLGIEVGSMAIIIIDNARIFDGFSAECAEGRSVLIERDRIREISSRPIKANDARRIDAGGRTLMPGLIDLHIHAFASDVNFSLVDQVGTTYRTAHAARMLGHALDSGFTTVRDVGGGDWGLWRAIEDRLIRAPRFFYSGKIISMTGGHGDFRTAWIEGLDRGEPCGCCGYNSLSQVADGVPDVIKAAREELRRGAHCIKIMGSGGVVSPTDPIWMDQYREDEICAIVGEAAARRSYVTAHCHPPSAIRRCVEFGVRCIEHGTLIDTDTAALVAERGAYVVPTMSTLAALVQDGERMGLPPASMAKAVEVSKSAIGGLDIMRSAGVKLGFGTDLLGDFYDRQSGEFALRSEVFSPVEILRQATSTGAEILQRSGELGSITEGALADLLLVDGDPIANLHLLAKGGESLRLIMRAGEIVKLDI